MNLTVRRRADPFRHWREDCRKSIAANRRQFLATAARGFHRRTTRRRHWGPAVRRPRRIRRSAPLKQIDAGVLNIGYADAGRTDAPAVLLLHGWPYDIHSYVEVAPLLVKAGYRVIVPYLRGFGTTRFLSSETVRNAQQSALGGRRRRADGALGDSDGHRGRRRLGSSDRQHHGGRVGRNAAGEWSRSAVT